MNLTKFKILEKIEYYLSLGWNFCLPIGDKNSLVNNILCNIVEKIYLIDENRRREFKSELAFNLQRFLTNKEKNSFKSQFTELAVETKEFFI